VIFFTSSHTHTYATQKWKLKKRYVHHAENQVRESLRFVMCVCVCTRHYAGLPCLRFSFACHPFAAPRLQWDKSVCASFVHKLYIRTRNGASLTLSHLALYFLSNKKRTHRVLVLVHVTCYVPSNNNKKVLVTKLCSILL